MFRRSNPLPTETNALPGRTEPVTVSGVHYVNGSQMKGPYPEGSESVFFAMGCFWGAERIFWEVPGVITTAAGYKGGYTENPSYEEVCTGGTGHTEAVHVVYDPERVSIDVLLKHFWEQHDPTTPNRQGNDVGTQYRSAIYWTTEEQRKAIESSKASYGSALSESGFGAISTEIRAANDAGEFFYAEEYHQQYLAKNPGGYCNHGFCQIPYAAPDGGGQS